MYSEIYFFGGKNMAVEFKKATIDNRMLNVVSYETFCANKDANLNSATAVEMGDYIYPVRSKTDNRPGIYNEGCINFFVDPPEGDSQYLASNVKDIGNAESTEALLKTMSDLKHMERQILTSPDNIYVPTRSDKDSPAMKGLKDAIVDKQIDLNKYQDRFGDSFINDKRILKSSDITLFMLNRFTKALDIKATLILEDKSPDVPNPMGTTIVIDLLNYDND